MAYYFLHPEIDTTIYSHPDRTNLNTGHDEILEIVKERGSEDNLLYPSRVLIKFKNEEIQDVISKLYLTVFGKYIIPSRVYLSCTRSSTYARKGTLPSFVLGNEPQKYVVVYPFTKTREWYLLPQEQRQKMMDQHINVSEKYPQVTLNTTYSFGIHDQDFMLAFECDDLRDFQNLIMDLRQTPVSAYVAVDTPMITCVKKDIVPIITSLG